MLVKEEDAKRYFCPVVSGVQQHIVCKGSHCMGWRWSDDAGDPTTLPDSKPVADRHGYCGLAGVITLPPRTPDGPP